HHIMQKAGLDAALAGNIGASFARLVAQLPTPVVQLPRPIPAKGTSNSRQNHSKFILISRIHGNSLF
ncbi:hypothetical protein, partial [Porphyromonas endodontalis]|uniref:hypothetical protein n=1 Tax=Porphyromonas endodontalis TaxID=28124 RepID=UPI00361DA5F6